MEILSVKDQHRCSSRVCPLLKKKSPAHVFVPCVLSKKDISLPWTLLVGEAPGEEEDRKCEPFVGTAGTPLRHLIRQSRPSNINVAISNTVKCRPISLEGRNRHPSPDEIAYCFPYLEKEISTLRPEIIVGLGGVASNALLQRDGSIDKSDSGIFSIRGKVQSGYGGYKILPTFHPAFCLRNPAAFAVLRVDLAKAFVWTSLSSFIAKCKKALTLENIEIIKTVARLKEVVNILKASEKPFSFDIECPSLARKGNKIFTLAFSNENHYGYVLAVDHPQAHWSDSEKAEIKGLLKELMLCSNDKIAHSAQFDSGICLDVLGIVPERVIYDTYMMAHFLEEEFQSDEYDKVKPAPLVKWLSLDTQISHWFEYDDPAWFANKKMRKDILELSLDDLLIYNAKDAILTYRLSNILRFLLGLKQESFQTLLEKVNLPLTECLVRTINAGVPVDVNLLNDLLNPESPNSLQTNLNRIESEFKRLPEVKEANRRKALLNPIKGRSDLFGEESDMINMSSPDDLNLLFFETLNLEPVGELGKSGKPSTNKAFLETYTEKYKSVELLSEWRKLQKVTGTFLTGLLTNSQQNVDGMVRPDIQLTAITGRTRVSKPGMQQLPRKDEDDPTKGGGIYIWIKRSIALAPDSGYCMIGADYSVHEVRGMAFQSEDPGMAKIFWDAFKLRQTFLNAPSKELFKRLKKEGDTHRQNAALMFNRNIYEVTNDERQAAKGLSFLVIFAKDPVGPLSVKLNCSTENAKVYVDKFLGLFTHVRGYFERIENFASNHGYVLAKNGRYRSTYGVYSPFNPGWGESLHALNVAHNMPVQGLASDIALYAGYKMWKKIIDNKWDWTFFLPVHDALYFKVPVADLFLAAPTIQDTLEHPGLDDWGLNPRFVPLQTKLEIGFNMADTVEWDGTKEHIEMISNWLKQGGDRTLKPKSPYA